MPEYRLCKTKKAQTPYYIEAISTNIYTIEELCFYMENNIYLLDETIIGEPLCHFLGKELGFTDLEHRLMKVLEGDGGITDFVVSIFKEIGYLSHPEIQKLSSAFGRLQEQPPVIRLKMKADYLLKNGKCQHALTDYRRTLAGTKHTKLGGQFVGNVYNNMGCAYMYLFDYEQGMEYFGRAFHELQTRDSLTRYLCAIRLAKTPVQYADMLVELGVSDTVRAEIEDLYHEASMYEDDHEQNSRDPHTYLNKLVSEYHNL